MENRWVALLFPVSLLAAATLCGGGIAPGEISRLEAEEQMIPVRPGDPSKGVPFWNARSTVFRRPPNFDFRILPNVTNYEFTVIDANHRRKAFRAPVPYATLSPVWTNLPAGPVTVICDGLDAQGRSCGRAGLKRFAKCANFTGGYPKPPRTCAEAVRRGYDYVAGVTNRTALYLGYPTKMRSAMIGAMVKYAARVPGRRAYALGVARAEAEALLASRAKPGTPLAGFTPTYAAEPIEGETKEATRYRGQSMNGYPAEAGLAFLALYGATGEGRYLSAAKDIGETYLKRQLPNGTWHLKEFFRDGQPVNGNLLVPNSVIAFLLKLSRATDDRRYLDGADRAFAYIERGPLRTFDWEGQFEDVEPSGRAYRNLSIHMSCDTALFLLERYPGDARRLAQAREILRFAEDQFVFWEMPPHAWMKPIESVRYPAAFEQYACYTPIDSSAAKAIALYAALYRAERKPLDLLKARALADSIVAVQDSDGRIPTWWDPEDAGNRETDWLNCMVYTLFSLELVDDVCRRDRKDAR